MKLHSALQASVRVVSEGLLCSCVVISRTCHAVSWSPCVLGRRQPLDASIAGLGDTEKHQALAVPPCMGQTLEPRDVGLGGRLIQKGGGGGKPAKEPAFPLRERRSGRPKARPSENQGHKTGLFIDT